MMMIDKDRAITTVIGRRRSKDGSTSEAPMVPSEVLSEEREPDPRHEAAKDLMASFYEKHPQKISEAMSAFIDMHMMHQGKEDSGKPDV